MTMKHIDDKFAVFILTNRRPDRVFTYKLLREIGYTGKIYLIVDDEDPTIQKYIDTYSANEVFVFPKKEAEKITDDANHNETTGAVIYARNYAFTVAEKLGIEYFLVLDDDYNNMRFMLRPDKTFKHKSIVRNFDYVLDLLLEYYKSTPIKSLCIAQGGDFIGGENNGFMESLLRRRKAMNFFICSTHRPFQFYGKINEDTTAYTVLGSRGDLFLTIDYIALNQIQTQQNAGGLTEIYLDLGTYVKSFYSVMYMPSSIKIREMGTSHRRLHHSVKWDNTVPMLIREKHRKAKDDVQMV